ncbi:MAG: hypothetical protein ACMXYG_03955 [Candidatus Woesearchaeota archaeon]
MPHQEILLKLPCDRKALIEFFKKERFSINADKNSILNFGGLDKAHSIQIINTFIKIHGDIATLNTNNAEEYQGKKFVNQRLYKGDKFISYEEQVKIFSQMRRVVESARKDYLREHEKELERSRRKHDELLAKIKEIIDYENKKISQEHKLEDALIHAKKLINDIMQHLPETVNSKKTSTGRVEVTGSLDPEKLKWENVSYSRITEREADGFFKHQMFLIDDILSHLKDSISEASLILEKVNKTDTKKIERMIKKQQKHLKKLSSKIIRFVRALRLFLRSIRTIQVTTPIRKRLNEIYTELYKTFDFYSNSIKQK